MGGTNELYGLISVNVFPRKRNGLLYEFDSNDHELTLLVKVPKQLEQYVEKAIRSKQDGKHIRMPCVLGVKPNEKLEHLSANLLIPPGIYKTSHLFESGLVVPDLRIIGGFEGGTAGHKLASDWVDDQEFYLRRRKGADISSHMYQGEIVRVNANTSGPLRPSVCITLASTGHGVVFKKNEEKLEQIAAESAQDTEGSQEPFWWQEGV